MTQINLLWGARDIPEKKDLTLTVRKDGSGGARVFLDGCVIMHIFADGEVTLPGNSLICQRGAKIADLTKGTRLSGDSILEVD